MIRNIKDKWFENDVDFTNRRRLNKKYKTITLKLQQCEINLISWNKVTAS